MNVVGLLNSLAQALCLHSWISSFQPPPGNAKVIVVVVVVVVRILFGWTPRLRLSESTFRSLARLLVHNDILKFWLDPSPLTL